MIPRRQIAALYGVNVTTVNQSIAGTQLSYSVAHRDEQLFSPGEEQAIADHCRTISECIQAGLSNGAGNID